MKKNSTPFMEGIIIMIYCTINFPIYVFVVMLAVSSKWQEVLHELGVLPFLIINVIFAFVFTGAGFLGAILMIKYREKGLDEKEPKTIDKNAEKSKFKPEPTSTDQDG